MLALIKDSEITRRSQLKDKLVRVGRNEISGMQLLILIICMQYLTLCRLRRFADGTWLIYATANSNSIFHVQQAIRFADSYSVFDFSSTFNKAFCSTT